MYQFRRLRGQPACRPEIRSNLRITGGQGTCQSFTTGTSVTSPMTTLRRVISTLSIFSLTKEITCL